MFRRHCLTILAAITFIVSTNLVASAQVGQLRGKVTLKQADGTTIPANEAAIDVFRTDVSGKYATKTNKKGEFVFAGLPYVGTYIVAASLPGAQPNFVASVKAGRDIEYTIQLSPGDGRRLTQEEIKGLSSPSRGGGAPESGEAKASSADDKAKMAEIEKRNAEITSKNEKAMKSNEVVARTFQAGNAAFAEKNYDEAIKQFEEGLAADPEQPALLVNEARAYTQRGVNRYNAAITTKVETEKGPGIEAAKSDFRSAVAATTKAVAMIKAQSVPTDAADLTKFNNNKLAAFTINAEAHRLFVTKADPDKVDSGVTAFEEYIAAETDPVRKLKGERDLAQMLFDASVFDKALVRYQKILETNPDDLDALLRSGQALFNIGALNSDKVKYQEAANFLARFVEKAPDTNAFKVDAKAILDSLKEQENVKPVASPTRRRRP